MKYSSFVTVLNIRCNLDLNHKTWSQLPQTEKNFLCFVRARGDSHVSNKETTTCCPLSRALRTQK